MLFSRLKGLRALKLISVLILAAFLAEVSDPSSSFIRVSAPQKSHHSVSHSTPSNTPSGPGESTISKGASGAVPMVHAGESASSHANTLGLQGTDLHLLFSFSHLTVLQPCFVLLSRSDLPDHPPKPLLS